MKISKKVFNFSESMEQKILLGGSMKNLAVRSMLLNANQDNEMIKKSLESQFQELSDKILLPLGDSRILEGILIEETASFSLNGYGLD